MASSNKQVNNNNNDSSNNSDNNSDSNNNSNSRDRALCENLIVAQLVRKFPEIYGNLPHPCPPLDELSPYPPNVFFKICFNMLLSMLSVLSIMWCPSIMFCCQNFYTKVHKSSVNLWNSCIHLSRYMFEIYFTGSELS